jgi:DNA-binding response OmpR family regulator
MTTSEHSPNSHAAPLSGCVLVVDDNDQLRQLLALGLETAGFTVIQAATQLDLQRRLADTQPDALILDLQRSEADGLRLLARMRARTQLQDVPILFLAGSDDDDFRWQALHDGADWFGLRPLALVELQKQLGTLIRNGRPEVAERLPRPPASIRSLKRTG